MSNLPINPDYYGIKRQEALTVEQKNDEHFNPFGKWSWQHCRPAEDEKVRTWTEQLYYIRTGRWMHKDRVYIQDGQFYRDGKPYQPKFDC